MHETAAEFPLRLAVYVEPRAQQACLWDALVGLLRLSPSLEVPAFQQRAAIRFSPRDLRAPASIQAPSESDP